MRIDEYIELIDGGSDEAWNHQKTDPLDRRMPEIEIEPEGNSPLHQERDLEEKLDHPSGENTQSQCHDRYFEMCDRKKDRNDDRDIEKNWSNRRCKEMPGGSSGFPCRGQKAP